MEATDEPPRAPSSSPRDVERSVEILNLFVQECRTCQEDAPPHWQFCAHCGSRLTTACPGCGSALPPLGARYCPHCSMELPENLWPQQTKS